MKNLTFLLFNLFSLLFLHEHRTYIYVLVFLKNDKIQTKCIGSQNNTQFFFPVFGNNHGSSIIFLDNCNKRNDTTRHNGWQLWYVHHITKFPLTKFQLTQSLSYGSISGWIHFILVVEYSTVNFRFKEVFRFKQEF